MLKWQEERHSPCGPAGWKARGWVHFGQSSNIPTPARSSFSWVSPQAHCFPSSGPPLHKCSLLMFLVTAAEWVRELWWLWTCQPTERRYHTIYCERPNNFLLGLRFMLDAWVSYLKKLLYSSSLFSKIKTEKWLKKRYCLSEIVFLYKKNTIRLWNFFLDQFKWTQLSLTHIHSPDMNIYICNEDLDKAQASFRDAIFHDERHYNAWYGLGKSKSVLCVLYMASYFEFRIH